MNHRAYISVYNKQLHPLLPFPYHFFFWGGGSRAGLGSCGGQESRLSSFQTHGNNCYYIQFVKTKEEIITIGILASKRITTEIKMQFICKVILDYETIKFSLPVFSTRSMEHVLMLNASLPSVKTWMEGTNKTYITTNSHFFVTTEPNWMEFSLMYRPTDNYVYM